MPDYIASYLPTFLSTLSSAGVVTFLAWLFRDKLLGSFAESYAKKTGEVIGSKHQLDEILRQLRITTEATTSIQSEFQRATWNQQTAWKEKRDVYLAAMEVLMENETAFRNLARVRNLKDDRQIAQANATLTSSSRSLHQIAARLLVFGTLEAVKICMNPMDNAPDWADGSAETALATARLLGRAKLDLAALARVELVGAGQPFSSEVASDSK